MLGDARLCRFMKLAMKGVPPVCRGSRRRALVAVLALCLPLPALAQQGRLIEGAQRTQQQAVAAPQPSGLPGILEEPAPPILDEGEGDFGTQMIMRPVPRKPWFRARFDWQGFYSSNILALHENEIDDFQMVSTAEFVIAPPWSEKVKPRAGFRHQFFNFIGNGEFDFDAQTIFTDIGWEFAKNWEVSLGYEFTRLLSAPFDREQFFDEQVANLSLSRIFELGEHMFLSLGYECAARFTNPQPFSRDEHSLMASYTQFLSERLIWQTYYRFQYEDYFDNGDRNDFQHIAGTMLSYHFNSWSSAGIQMSYLVNDSDQGDLADYEIWNGGVALNATLRF